MRYRLVYIGLTGLVVAVIALGIAFGRSGEPVELPPPIEAVFPAPGDGVIRQAAVEVDLEIGYEVELWIDGYRVPDGEISFVDATGVAAWAPSPTSVYMDAWTPGVHEVRVVWTKITGVPEVGGFTWEFRVQ